MSTIVATRNVSGAIAATQGAGVAAAVIIKRPLSSDVNLQSLRNVNSTNLQDGDTLVYDAVTNTWITQPVQLGAGLIDGGTY